jgi:hypothetical protein
MKHVLLVGSQQLRSSSICSFLQPSVTS